MDRGHRGRPWPAGLLLAYPPGWRARYGDELELLVADLAEHGRRPLPMAADLIRGAAGAWFMMRRGFAMSERSRGALITVLWSWVAFAATAAWFGHDLGRAFRQTQVDFRSGHLAGINTVARPALPDAYHALLGTGVIGLAVTAVAAAVFAIEAARHARAHRRWSTFALMAVPPVAVVAWLGGLRLISGGSRSVGGGSATTVWWLVGVAAIASATQAACTVVPRTEIGASSWRTGATCARAVTAVMIVGTVATVVWGIAFQVGHPFPDAPNWLIATVIMAVTATRACNALIGARRAARRGAAPAEPVLA